MHMLRRSSAVLLSLCLALLACGHGKADGQCQHNFDCPSGEACVSGACSVVPCGGGCQADEACGNDNTCVKACTLDAQCDPGFICNPALKRCAQCSNSTQCAGKKDTPVCDDTGSGSCVACNVDFDCTKALGSGHFCESHLCKPGCKGTADCNASLGETCDTTVTPGRCIQCRTNSDCAAQAPPASACDDTGHCVQCWGTTLAAANTFCGTGTPECNLASRICVACLPANNATGQDCGYPVHGTLDPHDARTCNPSTSSCQDGCQVDAQCGCPRSAAGGVESDCLDPDGATHRFPDQEHCDPKRTTMVGAIGATLGACVQCTDNTHCEYKIHGTTQYGGAYAAFNGARCVSDSCVEGCDADADCWPNHAAPNGRICHLGAPGDANNHKCVECKCDVAGADSTFCELNRDNSRACSNTAGGNPRVCDASTLSCRLRRQGEVCDHNNECGAQAAGTDCAGLDGAGIGFCVLERNPDASLNGGTPLYCTPAKGTPGRCGDFCGACSCGSNSYSCGAATSTDGKANTICVPTTCHY